MKLTITVSVYGQYGSWALARDIPELYEKHFEPLKTSDDVSIAYITGELIAESEAARIVIKARKDAADILAKSLANAIVAAMSKDDTHNGYQKEQK